MSDLQPNPLAEGEACFAATRALCNVCGALVEAKVVFRGDTVHLVKWCPEHGRSQALISADRRYYLRSLAYLKPMSQPRSRAVAGHTACPESCGLCPEHQQHTCVPLLEITDRCDLACPVCLVPCERSRGDLPLPAVRSALEALLRYEDRLNMLTLTGGEPSLHPELLTIVDEILARPEVGILSLSTNGVSLERRPELLEALVDRGVVFSLQLDGFDPAVSQRLRGRADLPAIKRRLLDRLLALDARISLTVTLERGVNEGELPGILELLFHNPQVLSVMVQPLARTGRAEVELPAGPDQGLTMPEVIALLAESSGGVLEASDFTPLPCSHPSCFALTYLMATEGGGLVPLPRILDAESYLDTIKNQALLNTDPESLLRIRDSLYALWSSDGIIPDREPVLKTVRQILLDLGGLGNRPGHREVLRLGARHIKSIFIHQFMDRYTFDLSRVVKCCNHLPQADGRLLPACVRNNLRR